MDIVHQLRGEILEMCGILYAAWYEAQYVAGEVVGKIAREAAEESVGQMVLCDIKYPLNVAYRDKRWDMVRGATMSTCGADVGRVVKDAATNIIKKYAENHKMIGVEITRVSLSCIITREEEIYAAIRNVISIEPHWCYFRKRYGDS